MEKQRSAHVIAVCNNKGGVGKTTTAVNVASYLARKGKQILLVDMDAQANLTYCISEGVKASPDWIVRREPTPVKVRENIDLIASDFTLSAVEESLHYKDALGEILEPLRTEYDYILIDTSPSVGILTLNAIRASDSVIITLTAEALPTQGMKTLEKVIETEGANILGYVITRYNSRLSLSRMIHETLTKRLGDKLFKTVIRENVSLSEAPYAHAPINEYSPRSNGAQDYEKLTKEIITRLNRK